MTRENAHTIEDQAADWIARLDRYGEKPEILSALDAWLAEDTRRHGAFIRAEAAFRLLGEELCSTAFQEHPEYCETHTVWTRRSFLGGTAGVLAASIAGGLIWFDGAERYTTVVGEVRRVPLADGSVAVINTNSTLRADFQPEIRAIEVKNGEAWFQVARNPARPFVVQADRVRVRAVGTAFSVRRYEGSVDVRVTEGVVETWMEGAEAAAVRLKSGQQALFVENAEIAVSSSNAAEIDRSLAWRSGQIDLAGETVEDAIAEFNRYNGRKIVLADKAIAHEPLFGVFRVDDPVGFTTAIHHGFNVPISLADPKSITIGLHL